MKTLQKVFGRIGGLCLLLCTVSLSANEIPKLAIIIDDLGYRLDQGKRVVALPGPVVCAVLPDTPRGKQLANLAHRQGKEVLLHLPLQSMDQVETPEGAIGLDTNRAEFDRLLHEAVALTPNLTGINNHKGSLVTRHPGHMRWLMEYMRERDDLLFVDSYTTHHSVALQIANEMGVPALRRDVFLDPDKEPATVQREFERAIRLAQKNGSAIAIGHPYPATLALLERELPRLADYGVELVALSRLLEASSASSVQPIPDPDSSQ
ncbi:MAG: divergent polysaccharide deacetylase family protein [Pseudomonadota bacterium]